jgi:DNA-binding transcriptional regulator YiaG
VLSSTFFPEVKMANIAGVLRDEISRLSRREIRKATESTKKATNQHRRAIAMLKSHVTKLTRQVLALTRTITRFQQESPDAQGSSSSAKKIRFVAKGLRANRTRLGLSAGDFGRLVGVSANSVYAWEAGTTTPRREQLTKIAALRTVGKREAAKRLAVVSTSKAAARRRR